MALFKDILHSDETLFKNELALDFDFVPKIMPYREPQQRFIAQCMKPLLEKRNGRNLLIHGPPGIGKTAAIRLVFRDLEEETDEVTPIYINCWKKNTTFKIITEICDIIGYKFIQNKRADELFKEINKILNKKPVVFCFDEIDKAEELDFIYTILEDIYKKSVFLVTNKKEHFIDMDDRIKSRLTPEILEFRQYNEEETKGILKQRLDYAFVPDTWDEDAFNLAAKKTFEIKDIRTGLYILKEAGRIAEEQSSRKITLEHVKKAVEKADEFNIKTSSDLDEESNLILDIIKENSGRKIGDLYKTYKEKDGCLTYKSFQRKIAKLEKYKFIDVNKTLGGKEGSTSIISYKQRMKKLSDF